MEITHTLPKYQTWNSQWHPKFNSYNCNMSFVKMQRTQSLTRLVTHTAISTFSTSHNSILSKYSQPFMTLAAPKANPIFHAANKNLILKHISTIAILLLHHHPPFISYKLSEDLTTLSEETTQRKHTYVTTITRPTTNKLSLANNNNNSFAKGYSGNTVPYVSSDWFGTA